MKVLFAPIHYFYGKNYGSEMICAADIFTRISKFLPGTQAVALTKLDEQPDLPSLHYRYSISKPFFPSIWDNFKLISFYTLVSLRLITQQHYTIVHHLFPFRIGRTFNPLFLIPGLKIKKIIGPVMVSVDYDNKDLKKNSFFATNENPVFNLLINFFDPLFALLSKATLLRGDHVIALNEVAKQELIKFGVPSPRITVIPIGIDTQKFSFTPYNKKNNHIFHLLTLGYLTKRKGTELLLKSLVRIIEKYPKVHLTIIGDGPQKSELEDLACQLDIDSHVTFAGFVKYADLEKYYQRSHVLVSMSRAESWGQVYLDAMACGLAIITSKNDGSNEIIKDGQFGYLVEQEDVAGLTGKVNYLISHPKLVDRFGKAARREIKRKYDWDRIVISQYLGLYER